MRTWPAIVASALVVLGTAATVRLDAVQSPAAAAVPPASDAMLAKYCASCHSDKLRTGGVVLEHIDLRDLRANAATLEKVVHKLRSGTMPPPGAPRPDRQTIDAVAASLEASLDRAAVADPNPGRVPALHRLNRAEYANAVRDLLAIEIDAASLLPPDDSGYGFDNIADVLSMSPMLTERYLAAAQKISRIAVGDVTLKPATDVFSVNKLLRQDDRVSEDLPFGSRGGIAIRHYFPVDGDYVVKIFLDRTYDGRVRGLGGVHQLEVRLNGEKVQTLTVGEDADAAQGGRGRASRAPAGDGTEVTLKAPAGPATVAVTFLKKASVAEGMRRPDYAVTSYEYAGDVGVPPSIGSVEVRGPYAIAGPGASPSRQRIFVCHPAANADRAAESRCAAQILTPLVRRAFRRPVAATDVAPFLTFYQRTRDSASFDAAIASALGRVLVSPDFLFRVEHDPADRPRDRVYRITDVELASRLSFFLWSSIPDDELLDAAARHQLHDPAVLERQVRRMLADRRATALVDNFAGQWLYLRNVRMHTPDPALFPDFDENLRQAFARELALFFESQVREDHGVADLLTADYTFVNERLARHYGIAGVYGDHFRRVTLADEARKGLLGKGAVLTVTSYASRTSPVLRGKWLLENVLGEPPAPPPPNVPALTENVAGTAAKSVRERMEQHRANPICASCHRVMDPLGFALENFDAVGRWRATSEAGTPIDASGTLIDGTAVDGPVTLRNALVSQPQAFVTTVTGKLMTYALGRGTESYDAPAIRQIVRTAAAHDYRWSDIILGIVRSAPFQMRSREHEEATQ